MRGSRNAAPVRRAIGKNPGHPLRNVYARLSKKKKEKERTNSRGNSRLGYMSLVINVHVCVSNDPAVSWHVMRMWYHRMICRTACDCIFE